MKLYVAYGSNLNLAQMRVRCPHASIYASTVLNNWELIYRGAPTNSHATIRRKKGCMLPVLVWSISDYDEEQLDMYEGYPTYYYKKNIMVNINGFKKKAMVYIMNESRLPGKPSQRYIRTIQQGYLDNDFDINVLIKSLELNKDECI
jgi:hypothetical protein